jgi:hypothetical protein
MGVVVCCDGWCGWVDYTANAGDRPVCVFQARGESCMGRTGLEEPVLESVPVGVVLRMAKSTNGH